MFFGLNHFQPSLIFLRNAIISDHKDYTTVDVTENDKQGILPYLGIIYSCKKFIAFTRKNETVIARLDRFVRGEALHLCL